MWLAVQLSSWILGVLAVFVFLGAEINSRYARIGRQLRDLVPPPRPLSVLEIPAEARFKAIYELAPHFDVRISREKRANLFARGISMAWARALDAPPGPLASVILMVVYLAFAALGVVLFVGE